MYRILVCWLTYRDPYNLYEDGSTSFKDEESWGINEEKEKECVEYSESSLKAGADEVDEGGREYDKMYYEESHDDELFIVIDF